ncbi:MAG: hypothetical protein KAI83_18485 [Thiomargarita sp.]|nr:hypothetical protein [Thiomargarita sp.]
MQILCLDSNNNQCNGNCNGQLEQQVEYGSHVRAKNEVSGPWSKGSDALSSDTGILYYDPPGGGGQQVFFQKAVVAKISGRSTWDAESILQTIKNGILIYTAIQTNGFEELAGNTELLDNTIKHLLGLRSQEGNDGVVDENMYVEYDSAGDNPIDIIEGQQYAVNLRSIGKAYGYGWGGHSESWSFYGSSYFWTAVARNFSCDSGVVPPLHIGMWRYDDQEGPHTLAGLQDNVEDYFFTGLGIQVDASNNEGSITIGTPGGCVPPPSGDWIITNSCTFEGSATAPANVIVKDGAVLTIANGAALDIDFLNHNLTVKQGSNGVLIKNGGKIH